MRSRIIAPLAALLLALAGCGGGTGNEPEPGAGGGGQRPDPATRSAPDPTAGCTLSGFMQGTCRPDSSSTSSGAFSIADLSIMPEPRRLSTFTGRPGTKEMDGYLDEVLSELESFWNEVYEFNAVGDVSSVSAEWVGRGETVATGCNATVDDTAALYCPADDTIYFGIAAAFDRWDALEIEDPRFGELAVVRTLGHEYGHNVQIESGASPPKRVRNFELQADCLAGVFIQHAISSDIRRDTVLEVLKATDRMGDYEYDSLDHHGTPFNRMLAVLRGLKSTEGPAACARSF